VGETRSSLAWAAGSAKSHAGWGARRRDRWAQKAVTRRCAEGGFRRGADVRAQVEAHGVLEVTLLEGMFFELRAAIFVWQSAFLNAIARCP
jgi:hypothetical protein